MLRLEDLKTYLVSKGISADAWAYNRTPAQPDVVITMTEIPATPYDRVEGALENTGVQIKARAPRENAVAARDTMRLIDQAITNEANRPFTLGTGGNATHVTEADRYGSPPSYFNTDQQNRVSYVCNYFFNAKR